MIKDTVVYQILLTYYFYRLFCLRPRFLIKLSPDSIQLLSSHVLNWPSMSASRDFGISAIPIPLAMTQTRIASFRGKQ